MKEKMILLPCCEISEDLWEIILDDPETWSHREKAKVDRASEHGDLYWAELKTFEDGFQIHTDLGDPDHRIAVEFPNYVSLRIALIAVQRVVDTLQECS